jgi:hypothetical protein
MWFRRLLTSEERRLSGAFSAPSRLAQTAADRKTHAVLFELVILNEERERPETVSGLSLRRRPERYAQGWSYKAIGRICVRKAVDPGVEVCGALPA